MLQIRIILIYYSLHLPNGQAMQKVYHNLRAMNQPPDEPDVFLPLALARSNSAVRWSFPQSLWYRPKTLRRLFQIRSHPDLPLQPGQEVASRLYPFPADSNPPRS